MEGLKHNNMRRKKVFDRDFFAPLLDCFLLWYNEANKSICYGL